MLGTAKVIVMFHLWAGHAGCGGMLSTWLENLINKVNTVEQVEKSSVKAIVVSGMKMD